MTLKEFDQKYSDFLREKNTVKYSVEWWSNHRRYIKNPKYFDRKTDKPKHDLTKFIKSGLVFAKPE